MSAAVERGDEISPTDKLDLDRSLVGLAALAAYRSGILSGVDDVAGNPGDGLESLAKAQDTSSRLGEPGASPDRNRGDLGHPPFRP